jgi:hypothetical protein
MSHDAHAAPTLHGIMAEFTTPAALVDATTKARLHGFRQMDAYSPIPIEELNDALGLRRTRLPRLVLLGGILGGSAVSASNTGLHHRLSDEHRRAAVQQLAAVHPRHVRDHGPRRAPYVLRRDVGAQQAAAAVPPGVQRARRSTGPRATGSSCASKPPIRGSRRTRPGVSSRACTR